jgi:integrase
MAAPQLSDLLLRRFQPTGKREQISDHVERGLRARISPTGDVSFILHARNGVGKLVLVTLGRYPDLSLKEAREQAARQRLALKQGADLNAEKRARKTKAATQVEDTSPTLRALLWEYQALFAPRRAIWRSAGPRSERSPALRSLEGVFAPLLDRPVNQITSAELAQAMAGYERRGLGASTKSTANGTVSRARAYLAPVLDWAAGRGRFSRHGAGRQPALEVADVRNTFDPAREDPTIRGERDRVLTEEELGRLLPLLVHPAPKELGAYADPENDFRPIALRFLLLTAARREEVVEMRWADVDLANGVWTKPRVKSTRGGPRKQVLPLSTAALNLLTSLPQCGTAKPTDYVFPNTTGGALGNWTRFQEMIERASGTSGWHRHDLRRTAATIMQALDVPVSTIDRILGHVNPLKRENVSGAAATYMRLSGVLKGRKDPQTAALDVLAEALDGMVESQGASEGDDALSFSEVNIGHRARVRA